MLNNKKKLEEAKVRLQEAMQARQEIKKPGEDEAIMSARRMCHVWLEICDAEGYCNRRRDPETDAWKESKKFAETADEEVKNTRRAISEGNIQKADNHAKAADAAAQEAIIRVRGAVKAAEIMHIAASIAWESIEQSKRAWCDFTRGKNNPFLQENSILENQTSEKKTKS